MKRRVTIWAICFVALIAWAGLVCAQTTKTGTMKTVKYSDGEEVCDLTGEWDAFLENLGEWAKYGSYSNEIKIKLEGRSFIGTRLKDNGPNRPAGSLILICSLDKSGFKNIILNTGFGPFPCKGQISEDGNKIIIEMDTRAKVTLTRK